MRGRICQRLAGEVVNAFSDAELIGHEVVEADVDRALRRDDIETVDERVQHHLQAVDPRCRDLLHRHRRAMHPRGIGDHREHGQRYRHGVAVGAHHDRAGKDGVSTGNLLEVLG